MGYQNKAFLGFSGQTAIQIGSNVITLGKIAILARLLAPTDFGLFSLVMIALGLTEAFTQTGVNTTIVQSDKPVKFFVNSAWVIAIVRGLLISLIMVGLGWGMSYYYHQSLLFPLITLAALIPLIKGFINPAIVEIYKELSFISDSVYRFSLVVVEAAAIVVLVAWHPTVQSWVAGLLVSAGFEVLISFVFFKLKPRFEYNSGSGKVIFGQMKVLSLNSFLSYLIENVDNLIIGKVNGEFNLGIYQPTYSLGHEVNYAVAQSVHHATLPIYTKVVHEPARLQKAFRKTALVTITLMTLGSLPLILFPHLVISLILSDKWLSAVELVRWMTMAGWLQGVSLISYTLLIARNKIAIINWHMAVNLVLLIIGVYFGGTYFGLLGAVIGVLLSRVFAWPIIGWATWKELQNHG